MNRLWLALRYSSTLPLRSVLAVTAAMWSLLFVLAPSPSLSALPTYQLMSEFAPAQFWPSVFALDALALTWRIVERHPRIGWTRLINAMTCGLWTMYLACLVEVYGFAPPGCAAVVGILLCAIWCTLRTDLTLGDRESA